jgi:hypothetical protein
MRTQAPPSLETIEGILNEVDEYYDRVSRIRQKMRRHKRGSEPYLELLADLSVEVDVLKNKAQWAEEVIEAFEDSLPDE